MRRRPTLPHSFPCSTIGPAGLNFRGRGGNGRDPRGMITANLLRLEPRSFALSRSGFRLRAPAWLSPALTPAKRLKFSIARPGGYWRRLVHRTSEPATSSQVWLGLLQRLAGHPNEPKEGSPGTPGAGRVRVARSGLTSPKRSKPKIMKELKLKPESLRCAQRFGCGLRRPQIASTCGRCHH